MSLVSGSCVSYRTSGLHNPERSLAAIERPMLFDEVWNHVADRYYEAGYNRTDWQAIRAQYRPQVDTVTSDAGLHQLLSRMVGELRDAHSRYLSPTEALAQRVRLSRGIGATLTFIGDTALIETVIPGSPAERAGLLPGVEVRAIDGEPVENRVLRMAEREPHSSTMRSTQALLWRRMFSGLDSAVLLTVRTDSGFRNVDVERRSSISTPTVFSRMVGDSVLYVRFDGFRTSISQSLHEAMRRHANAKAIVLDLRNNGGGDADETLRSTGLFLRERTPAGEFFSRVPRRILGVIPVSDRRRLTIGGDASAETRPLVILTSVYSGSGAELMSAVLQEQRRATIVGDTTCGCLTAVTRRVPMRGGGALAISNRGYRTGNGTIVEGAGVIPDIVVRAERRDLMAQRDVVLEQALAHLQRGRLHSHRR